MKRLIFSAMTLVALVIGSSVAAQNRPISGDLPWNNDAATPVLQQRLERMFPDGTPIAVLEAALAKERFSMVSDDRGFTNSFTEDRRRFASRGVARFRFGCSSRVMLEWYQRDGTVYDVDGMMHEGCL